MTKPQICPGGGVVVTVSYKGHLRPFEFFMCPAPIRPNRTKRIRLTCPKCGRRVLSSVEIDHDGDDVYHTLPPHKIKQWWKRKNKKQS